MSPLNELLHDHENRVAVKEHELADVYPLFHQHAEAEAIEELTVRGENILSWSMVSTLTLLPILVFLAYQLLPSDKWFDTGTDKDSLATLNLEVERQTASPMIETTLPALGSRAPVAPLTSSRAVGGQAVMPQQARWTRVAETKYLSLSGHATSERDLLPVSASQHISGSDSPVGQPRTSVFLEGTLALVDKKSEARGGKKTQRIGHESIVKKRGLVVKSPSGVMKESSALRKAKNLIFDGHRQEAILHLSTLLEITPNADNARLVLAGWLAQDGEWEKVNTLLAGVNERSDQRFRRLKARMFIQQGNVQQAVNLLESNMPELRLVPEYYALLGVAYQRAGRFSESVVVYEQLVQTDQTRGDWWGGLAIGFDQTGDKMAALDAYREALGSFDIQPHLKQYARQRIALLSRSAG